MSINTLSLFHATCSDWAIGDVITATSPTRFYPDVVAVLERARPPGLPSRSTCVFAADSAEAAARFLSSQAGVFEGDIKIYRVKMDVCHRAPLRLIHEIQNRIRGGQDLASLISEYWSPQKEWVFWEYFGPSFSVIEVGIEHDSVKTFAIGLSYERDVNQSKAF